VVVSRVVQAPKVSELVAATRVRDKRLVKAASPDRYLKEATCLQLGATAPSSARVGGYKAYCSGLNQVSYTPLLSTQAGILKQQRIQPIHYHISTPLSYIIIIIIMKSCPVHAGATPVHAVPTTAEIAVPRVERTLVIVFSTGDLKHEENVSLDDIKDITYKFSLWMKWVDMSVSGRGEFKDSFEEFLNPKVVKK
jgi:hypothetical protein